MMIFSIKSTFLESGILAVRKRELIIEEVHSGVFRYPAASFHLRTAPKTMFGDQMRFQDRAPLPIRLRRLLRYGTIGEGLSAKLIRRLLRREHAA